MRRKSPYTMLRRKRCCHVHSLMCSPPPTPHVQHLRPEIINQTNRVKAGVGPKSSHWDSPRFAFCKCKALAGSGLPIRAGQMKTFSARCPILHKNSNKKWFGSVQSTAPLIFFFSSQNKPFSFPPRLILDPMKCFIQLQNEMSFQNISWNNIPF